MLAALEKSFWGEENGTARWWLLVNLFGSEAQHQASVAYMLMVGVVGCVRPMRALVACCIRDVCQDLHVAAEQCGQIIAADDSEYHIDTKGWLLQIYQESDWDRVSMLCNTFPWTTATTFGYDASSHTRINSGSKLAVIDGDQFLLLQAWYIFGMFEKCSITIVQILRDFWPSCKFIILFLANSFRSGVS